MSTSGARTRRLAVVTGAASGIGLAIARRLAADGVDVVMVDCSPALRSAADATAGAEGRVLDVADEHAVAAFAGELLERRGHVDILVNSAGINPVGPAGPRVEDTSLEHWHRTLSVNLTGPFLLCRALLPAMKAQGWGRVVNIASRAGRTGVRGSGAHYAASKGGLIALTRTIAVQAAKYGVTANCIAPGYVKTPMTQVPDDVAREMTRAIPVGRPGTAEEMAAIAAFLAGDEAGYITGAVIDANGGGFMG